VNDAPEVNLEISDSTVEEDSGVETVNLSDYFSDADGDTLSYTVEQSTNEYLVINIDEGVLSIRPIENMYGETVITVNASDGLSTVNSSFRVRINAVNDAPEVNLEISDSTVEEDSGVETVNLSDYFSDADGDTLSYTVEQSTNEYLVINIDEGVLSIRPIENMYGETEITVNASDGLSTVNSSFRVTINAVNDVPEVNLEISDSTVEEDSGVETVNLSDYFSDVDGDALSYTVEQSTNDYLVINIDEGVLSITPIENMYGETEITVNASDGLSAVNSSFRVTINAVNDEPEVNLEISDSTVEEDSGVETVNLSDYFSDADGDTLSYTVEQSTNDYLVINIDEGVLSITPIENMFGETVITVNASDGLSTVNSSFTVTINAVNDAPEVNLEISDSTVEEDSSVVTVNLTEVFSDADGDTLSYTVEQSINDYLTISIEDGVLSITPIENMSGETVITVNASDGTTTVSSTFTVTISASTDSPVLNSEISDITVEEDSSVVTVNLTEVFSDADGDTLSYTVEQSINDYLTISIEDGVLSITPKENAAGSVTVTVNAKDENGSSVNDEFVVYVTAENDAPVFSNVSGYTITMNSTAVIGSFEISDVENDEIVYSITGNDASLFGINVNTGELEALMPFISTGTYYIQIIASDGVDATDRDIVIYVVNDDTDNDGISDEDELEAGLNPNDASDALIDNDGDGISNKDEVNSGCLNYSDARDAFADLDNDGISNYIEIAIRTNVCLADSDGDGVNDGVDQFMFDETESEDENGDNIGDEQEDQGQNLETLEQAYSSNTIIIDSDRTESDVIRYEECKLIVENSTTELNYDSGSEWVKCMVTILESQLLSKELSIRNSFVEIDGQANIDIDENLIMVETVLNSSQSTMEVKEDVVGYSVDMKLTSSNWDVAGELRFEGGSALALESSQLTGARLIVSNTDLSLTAGSRLEVGQIQSNAELTFNLDDSSRVEACRISNSGVTVINSGSLYTQDVESELRIQGGARFVPCSSEEGVAIESNFSTVSSNIGVYLLGNNETSLSVNGSLTISGGTLNIMTEDSSLSSFSKKNTKLNKLSLSDLDNETEFVVFEVANIIGEFDSIVLPEIDESLFSWDTSDLYSSGRLRLVGVSSTDDELAVIGQTLAFPSPYRLRTDDSIEIGFEVNKTSPVVIYIYNMKSELVLEKTVEAEQGEYTKVMLNESDFSFISAGAYIYVIVVDGKALATGKFGVLP
jgi:phosphoribosyl-AMP cyclohydrolase